MVRFATSALIVAMVAGPAWGQSAGPSADTANANDHSSRPPSYQLSQEGSKMPPAGSSGSLIIAGTELAPNAVVGVGMFGFKGEKAMHSPVTVRDLATARSRKAAVGFSLRF